MARRGPSAIQHHEALNSQGVHGSRVREAPMKTVSQDAIGRRRGKGLTMHGFARLRLVGTLPVDGVEECSTDDVPGPLPFPTCVRELPIGSHGGCAAAQAILALDRVNLSIDRLREQLEAAHGDEGPRAA